MFQICRKKGVILSAKKLVMREWATFVGHDVDSQGLNMTEPRIASAIAFKTPETLKELMPFLELLPGPHKELFHSRSPPS